MNKLINNHVIAAYKLSYYYYCYYYQSVA